MKIHLLSGFLGSGKTTAIQQACNALIRQGIGVGVITNDQGIKLVDEGFFNSLGIPNRQVINGCFCCNYNDLDDSIESLISLNNPGVIFAESVGSCTDIVATVFKPLKLYRNAATVTISVFADVRLLSLLLKDTNVFDESVAYIYHKQLEEAGIIIINKIDLIDAGELDAIKVLVKEKYPSKHIIYQQSLTVDGVQEWLQLLDTYPADEQLPSLQIDYDVYGEGEAKLAWFDEVLSIQSSAGNALQCADHLIKNIYQKITDEQLPIGHLKFLVNNTVKISYTSIPLQNNLTGIDGEPAENASLLINARVQTEPEVLEKIIQGAIGETEKAMLCSITQNSLASFKPGYPTPTYRLQN